MKFIFINDNQRVNLAHIADFYISPVNGNVRITFTHNKLDEDWDTYLGLSVVASDTLDIYENPDPARYEEIVNILKSFEV